MRTRAWNKNTWAQRSGGVTDTFFKLSPLPPHIPPAPPGARRQGGVPPLPHWGGEGGCKTPKKTRRMRVSFVHFEAFYKRQKCAECAHFERKENKTNCASFMSEAKKKVYWLVACEFGSLTKTPCSRVQPNFSEAFWKIAKTLLSLAPWGFFKTEW